MPQSRPRCALQRQRRAGVAALTGRMPTDLPVTRAPGMMARGWLRGARRRPAFRWRTSDMTRFRISSWPPCAAAAVVLAGCEATDSFAHDPEKAKTRRGRGIRRGCRRGRRTADRRQQPVQVGDDRRGRGRAGRRRRRLLHGQAGSEAAPADGRHRRRCRPQRRQHHARHAGQRHVRASTAPI